MRATFSLERIKELIKQKKEIISERALADAFADFNYSGDELLKMILVKLKEKHFFKTEKSEVKPGLCFDVYKRKIYVEKAPIEAYIKLRIVGSDEEEKSVIISFHKSLV